jgi:hypothetical protein
MSRCSFLLPFFCGFSCWNTKWQKRRSRNTLITQRRRKPGVRKETKRRGQEMKRGTEIVEGIVNHHITVRNTAAAEEERKKNQTNIQEVNHLPRNLPLLIEKEMTVLIAIDIAIVIVNPPVNIEVEVAVILVREEETNEEEEVIQEVEVHQEEENMNLLIIREAAGEIEDQEVGVIPHQKTPFEDQNHHVPPHYLQSLLGKSFVKKEFRPKQINFQISFGMVSNG